MYFFKEFHYFFLRESDDEELLVDEDTETVGAINNTPVAAINTFLWPTLITEPLGTYSLNFPSNTLICSSKAALTSSGASCTASISCSAWASDKSDTSTASKISVAWSAVTDSSTSRLVARAVASSELTPFSIILSTAACTSDWGKSEIAPNKAVTSGPTWGSCGGSVVVVGANVVVVKTVVEVVDGKVVVVARDVVVGRGACMVVVV